MYHILQFSIKNASHLLVIDQTVCYTMREVTIGNLVVVIVSRTIKTGKFRHKIIHLTCNLNNDFRKNFKHLIFVIPDYFMLNYNELKIFL